MRATLPAIATLALLALSPLAAQTAAQRLQAVEDGTIRLRFTARAGVHGHAGGITIWGGDEDWVSDCGLGPVRVSLRMRGGRVAEAQVRVAGHWRGDGNDVSDLGLLPSREAADLLLALAWGAGADAGGELITAATLADSAVVWPELLRMARARELPRESRRQAVFWLGQAAGEAATRGLDALVGEDGGDLELREHAVFALSQRPAAEGVPTLIRIARANPHPQLRRKALFWLGQTDDPRALTLFEELLR